MSLVIFLKMMISPFPYWSEKLLKEGTALWLHKNVFIYYNGNRIFLSTIDRIEAWHTFPFAIYSDEVLIKE